MISLTKTSLKNISISILLLRIIVGLILFVVGSGKVFGWFGGAGLAASLQSYLNFGISLPLAYLSIFTEFIGGLLLILGLFTRLVSVAIIINFIVATFVSFPMGIFLASFPLSLAVSSIAIFIVGPMQYSLDQIIQPISYRLSEHSKSIE